MSTENCTEGGWGILYEIVSEEVWGPCYAALNYFEYQPWFFSLIGSIMVGLSGIFPLFIIPVDQGIDLKHGESAGTLNVLLSFAVGGLLGDVFLHLLPEAWGNKSLNQWSEDGHASMACGLWVLGGFLVFVIAEKLFSGLANEEEEEEEEKEEEEEEEEKEEKEEKKGEGEEGVEVEGGKEDTVAGRSSADHAKEMESLLMNNNNFQKELENNNCLMPNGNVKNGCVKGAMMLNGTAKDSLKTNGGNCCDVAKNGCKNFANAKNIGGGYNRNVASSSSSVSSTNSISQRFTAKILEKKEKSKHISGYLNLLANSIDNFTHGLAVGGAFLVSFRLGAFTTFAILVHEIPHEVGDFAILLRSGFKRWDAAKAQLLTAGGGICGAMAAVLCSGGSVEARTSWIIPFTAGGFLHIGMVTILPELLQETNRYESLKQLAALLFGISLMAVMTAVYD